jgi:hypothetical protein
MNVSAGFTLLALSKCATILHIYFQIFCVHQYIKISEYIRLWALIIKCIKQRRRRKPVCRSICQTQTCLTYVNWTWHCQSNFSRWQSNTGGVAELRSAYHMKIDAWIKINMAIWLSLCKIFICHIRFWFLMSRVLHKNLEFSELVVGRVHFCYSSPAQSFLVPSHEGLMAIYFTVSRLCRPCNSRWVGEEIPLLLRNRVSKTHH